MRQILFRGKTIDGKWAYGYYVFRRKRRGAFGQTVSSLDFDTHYIVINTGEAIEIDPSTVGQYTGLTDKNGKKIFEGDIVKHYFGRGKRCTRNDLYDLFGIKRILYDVNKCKWLGIDVDDNNAWEISADCVYEVIGNIHDNPELVEGGCDND